MSGIFHFTADLYIALFGNKSSKDYKFLHNIDHFRHY